jgi:serine/threonine protein kinase
MQTDERLMVLLERWAAEADEGRLLSAAELCRDCPDLLPEAERRIAVLRQFHLLAPPEMSTAVEGEAQRETTDSEPALATSGVALPDIGGRFGRYEVLDELGKGGMGIVYKARDTQLGRDVALKVMRPDVAVRPNTSERFLREARALAAVRHDHVVEIYDYGERDGVRFVTMPLLAGETLETRLERQGPLPPGEVVRIGTELAAGLAAIHEKGLIHRDLKPSNVWLEAPSGRVTLLDFGLARDPQADDGLTSPGSVAGTPAYMSPEQVNGLALDARTDLFSLGSVLYKTATGRPAFAAPTTSAILATIGEKDPVPARTLNPAVPARLSDLIERLHRKNPANRPASATEVVKELRGLVAGPEAPTTGWRSDKPQESLRQGKPNRFRPEGQGVTRGALLRLHRQAWSHRVGLAVASMLGLLLVLGTVVLGLNMSRYKEVEIVAPPDLDQPAAPLRIRRLEVLHLEHFDDKRTRPPRVFGTDSFGASPDDDIKVAARLSRPAYCYLIVFRPDGQDEVLYPPSAEDVPERTDSPRYPSKDRSKVYGLTDGTGLWLVALVASEKPLPAYAEWRHHHPGGPWAKSDGEANVVWLDDGQWIEAVTPRGLRNRGERGEKEAAGTAPIVRVVDWLKAETGGTVSAVGFTVEAKK